MKVSIRKIEKKEEEQVIIECVKVTPQVEDICAYARSRGEVLYGTVRGKDDPSEKQSERFLLTEVLYFEAVDERLFAYTKEQIYEIRGRLYEIEETYRDNYFVRCSKSVVLNLMQLKSISPALNGRFSALMKNGEKLIISRQYAPVLKKIVMGE